MRYYQWADPMKRQNPDHENTITLRVWDAPVRIFHWLLVMLVFAAWLSTETGLSGMLYHLWIGHCILALVIFRILWGFGGGFYARFSQFARHPREIRAAARDLIRGQMHDSIGHNPLGGAMVMVLLILLLLQILSGLCADNGFGNVGPVHDLLPSAMGEALTEWHEINFNLLLIAIALHIAAIIFYHIRGERLVVPMISGKKHLPAERFRGVPQNTNTPWRRAMAMAMVAIALSFATRLLY